jgi:hypothetical protein
LEWTEEAQRPSGAWIASFLAVLGGLLAALSLAAWCGLLPG